MKSATLWRSEEFNSGTLNGVGLTTTIAHIVSPANHWLHSNWVFVIGFAVMLAGGEWGRRAYTKRVSAATGGVSPELVTNPDGKP